MQKEGKLYICDRCGKSIFEEMHDNGITNFPACWDYASYHEHGLDLLCDECYPKFKQLLKDFKESGKKEKEESVKEV